MVEAYRRAVEGFCEGVRAILGDRLLSVVLYGSVATGRARPESDLDVLVVAADLPAGTRCRQELLQAAVEAADRELRSAGLSGWLAAVVRTPEEVARGGPLFYDMTVPGEAELLYDPSGFMGRFLAALREKMNALGARRLSYRGRTYWDLTPRWEPGKVVDL